VVKPKKQLGQHFLHNEKIARKIIEAFNPPDSAFIYEIGFGTGVLTKHLLKYPNAYFLDVDRESYEFMKKNFSDFSDRFLLQDFLKKELSKTNKPLYLIGNLPYNISSQIFFKVFENHDIIQCAVFMVQKEVAQRLASIGGDKDYGILSVLIGAYYDVKVLFDVNKGAFNPPPQVTSSVIKLEKNHIKNLPVADDFFKTVVKAVFGKRRKMLRNSLKDVVPGDLPACAQRFLNLRPEQISIEGFIELAKCLSS
jgi:16S rRNA (adenine1518-N6/adenine1519-N6)-dimethyltransferase